MDLRKLTVYAGSGKKYIDISWSLPRSFFFEVIGYWNLYGGIENMVKVDMELPDEMAAYAMPQNKEEQLLRNAMMLYPYIWQRKISHGRAAEILGMYKMDLITLYGKLGIPYIEMADAEIEEELETVNDLKGVSG